MKNPTLDQFLPEYKRYANANLKPATLRFYNDMLDRLICPVFGRRRLGNLSVREIEKWHLKLRERPTQANRALAVLSAVLQKAAQWGYIPVNPARGIRRAKEKTRERYLTPDEIARLRATVDAYGPIERGFILVALLTGARPGELLSARWGDFKGETLELPDSKTGRRTIYLSAEAQEILRGLHVDEPPDELIFPGVEPTLLWRRIRRKARLGDARLYDLRHTFASRGLESGLALEAIALLLGHRNTQTSKRYTHLTTEAGRQAVNQITF